MKKSYNFAATLAGIICFAFFFSGCSGEQGRAQTKEFTLAQVKSIKVDYDGESVTVKKSNTDKIVVVEYLNKKQKTYYAQIKLSGDVLTVTEGQRPIGNGVKSYIELYLPQSFQNSLSLHTTDGRISSDLALTLESVYANTTNGTISISNLSAKQIDLSGTGGEMRLQNIVSQSCKVNAGNADTFMDSITGEIAYQSKGGNLTLNDTVGFGRFEANGDGNMEIAFASVSGDVSAYAKNGSLTLTLPAELEFALSATTKDGKIKTPFSESLSTIGETVGGTIGKQADFKIGLETRNGDITVAVH